MVCKGIFLMVSNPTPNNVNLIQSSNEKIIYNFLELVYKHRDLIVAAYDNKLTDDRFIGKEELIAKLEQQKILTHRNNSYQLNHDLQKVLNSVVGIVRSSDTVYTALKDRYPQLQSLVERYRSHLDAHENEDVAYYLDKIDLMIGNIVFDAQRGIDNLDTRLRTKFGFVRTLKDKFTENTLAITEAQKLVEDVSFYTYDKLADLAQKDDRLYKMFCVQFADDISFAQQRLSVLLEHLHNMLVVFRSDSLRTTQLKAFATKYKKDSGYLPLSYISPDDPKISAYFCRAMPLNCASHADLQNDNHDEKLVNIIEKLKDKARRSNTGNSNKRKLQSAPTSTTIATEEYQEVDTDVLDSVAEAFLVYGARNAPQKCSAVEYYYGNPDQFKQAHCDLNNWLFALCNYYENVPQNMHDAYQIEYVAENIYQETLDNDALLQNLASNYKTMMYLNDVNVICLKTTKESNRKTKNISEF